MDLGVPLGVASTTRFVRFVGPAKAKEIIMGCHRYSAAEAEALGLVTRAVPGSDLEGAVKDYAQHLLKKPFRALVEVKARINAIASNGTPIVNAMTVDGDTSTNDAFMLIASNQARMNELNDARSPDFIAVRDAVTQVAIQLAQAIVRDGEGATKFITVQIDGGRTVAER